MTGSRVVASRVMKARRTGGICPLCRATMITGQLIGLYAGFGWSHVACACRKCEHCGQRLPLSRIKQGHTSHHACEPKSNKETER